MDEHPRSVTSSLRSRIARGDWAIGERLPGLSALQGHYGGGVSLETIRRAQRALAREGLLRIEEDGGAFVTSTTPIAPFNLVEELDAAAEAIARTRAALGDIAEPIVFDLADDITFNVLTGGLDEYRRLCERRLTEARERERPDEGEIRFIESQIARAIVMLQRCELAYELH